MINKNKLIVYLLTVGILFNSCSSQDERQHVKQSRQKREQVVKSTTPTNLNNQLDTIKLDTSFKVIVDTNVNNNTSVNVTTNNTEVTIIPESKDYIRQKNTKHLDCQFKEEIDFILKAKLQLFLTQQNKPIQYFSQWTLDMFDIEYTRNEVIEYYENKINQELEYIIKNTRFNFQNVDKNKPVVYSIKK